MSGLEPRACFARGAAFGFQKQAIPGPLSSMAWVPTHTEAPPVRPDRGTPARVGEGEGWKQTTAKETKHKLAAIEIDQRGTLPAKNSNESLLFPFFGGDACLESERLSLASLALVAPPKDKEWGWGRRGSGHTPTIHVSYWGASPRFDRSETTPNHNPILANPEPVRHHPLSNQRAGSPFDRSINLTHGPPPQLKTCTTGRLNFAP